MLDNVDEVGSVVCVRSLDCPAFALDSGESEEDDKCVEVTTELVVNLESVENEGTVEDSTLVQVAEGTFFVRN